MKLVLVVVNDLMQQGYFYYLTEPIGQNFHPDFHPDLTPKEMLELGVFGGKYMTDCAAEYPADWFENAKLCPERHDPRLNYYGVNASLPLSVWRAKGWIFQETPGAGFSGIVVTSWENVAWTMSARSGGGRRSGDISCRWKRTADPVILIVGVNRDRHCYTGPMIPRKI